MAFDTGILSTIGHTPLVELNKLFSSTPSRVFAKLEMFNPGGSTKDRTAALMLSKAMKEGKIDRSTTIIESSSGNMAIGLAQVCRYLDLKLIVVTDPKINRHTVNLIEAYGAKVDHVTEADSGGNYLETRLSRVRELREKISNSYWPNQYENDLNPEAHYQTMKEIVDACPQPPDYILAATSTCGTIMGCARYVRQHNLKTKVVAVDAMGSEIFGKTSGERLIPGHGAGRESDLLDKSFIDHVFNMTDIDCVVGCRRLLKSESILAGGSSGAVVMAAKKMQFLIPENSSCVLIFADSGERYLETIFNDSWVQKTFSRPQKPRLKDSDRNRVPASMPAILKHSGLIDQRWPNKNGGGQDYS